MIVNLVPDLISYLTIGKEIAPTTGTPHLQGYLELKKKMTGRSLKTNLPNGIYLAPAKGTGAQNTTYCTKGGDSRCLGAMMKQGARKDLDQLKEMIEDGATEVDLADANFGSWLRYGQAMKRYHNLVHAVKRDWMPEIYIYWGGTGLGKTRKVMADNSIDDTWIWNGNHKFYQGYDMQSVAVFDDFYGEISLPYMLKLTDRYPMIVNIKNGECNWQPKRIYFTSNVDPRTWEGWQDKPQAVRDAFFRRVRENGGITHFDALEVPVNE